MADADLEIRGRLQPLVDGPHESEVAHREGSQSRSPQPWVDRRVGLHVAAATREVSVRCRAVGATALVALGVVAAMACPNATWGAMPGSNGKLVYQGPRSGAGDLYLRT